MYKISIINYQVGNLSNLYNYFNQIYGSASITDNYKDINTSDIVILPGVGSYESAINCIEKKGFLEELYNFKLKGKKIIGICLGFQLLFKSSNENSILTNGLGFFNYKVKNLNQFKQFKNQKIPHIGWNDISIMKEKYFYFLHSYAVEAELNEDFTSYSTTDYEGLSFISYVEQENIFGVQFHPEKSNHAFDERVISFIKK